MTSTNTYVPSLPQRPRVNMRVIAFLLAVSAPFLFIAYLVVPPFLTGGIVKHGDYVEADLKALGQFLFDERVGTVNDVPQKYRELDGKRVKLDGFMYVGNSSGPTAGDFQLVYNIQKCCFGGPPKVQERVFGHLPKGARIEVYDSSTLVQLTGILHVRVVRDEAGNVLSLYDMDVEGAAPRT